MKIEIHLNETVEVVLTKEGADIYNERWANSPVPERYKPAQYKEGDTLKLPLWELMHDFGQYTTLGMMSPFKDPIVTFKKAIS